MMRLSVAATYVDVDMAARRLRELAASRLSGEALDSFEIAVIEALTNIVRHGYGDAPGRMIDVRAEFEGEHLVVELRDTGIAVPEGAFDAPSGLDIFDDESEHGRGIGLILQCTTAVRYRTEKNVNVLTLTF